MTDERQPVICIDPRVDCVFKALLGSEENQDLLIHFFNAFINIFIFSDDIFYFRIEMLKDLIFRRIMLNILINV